MPLLHEVGNEFGPVRTADGKLGNEVGDGDGRQAQTREKETLEFGLTCARASEDPATRGAHMGAIEGHVDGRACDHRARPISRRERLKRGLDIRIREMPEVAERLDAMTHRRSMKSHTPMDGLPLDDQAQYICVFRHPLDAHFSYRKHVRNIPMPWFDHWYPEDDVDGVTFRRFLDGGAEGFDGDAMPLAHIIQHFWFIFNN